MANLRPRKSLSAKGLLALVRQGFDQLSDSKHTRGISLSDILMSGLAVFGLKYPSLLQFDRGREDPTLTHNLRSLYGIDRVPSDTYLRERLDEVEPQEAFRKIYKQLFAALQRGKALEDFRVLDQYYLLSVDGTGVFSSEQVHCDQCCEKRHRDGRVTYYHQLLGAVIVHPSHREVIPLMPEPIMKGDGEKKNDCERNASKRLLNRVRTDHPHLSLLVVEDGLSSNGPHIRLLKSLNMRYLLGAKPKDHVFLYDWVDKSKTTCQIELKEASGTIHRFRYLNGVPLNDSHFDVEVNFLEYVEQLPNGKTKRFCWVTDIEISEDNLMGLMRSGRARWKIENETFNTLKNQGYHLEHNFGHGYQHLSTVLMHLMMLAFLIDQIQQRCCAIVKQGQQKMGSRYGFWQKVRVLFGAYRIHSWEDLYLSIAYGQQSADLQPQPPP